VRSKQKTQMHSVGRTIEFLNKLMVHAVTASLSTFSMLASLTSVIRREEETNMSYSGHGTSCGA
jgi:hypothetical protein